MWIWHEGEFYDNQNGSIGLDNKKAASGGQCLGNNWGTKTGHYVEYRVNLDSMFPRTVPTKDMTMYVRYARMSEGNAYFDVLVNGRLTGPSPSLTLPSTGGWGDDDKDWTLATVPLGALSKDEHIIRIQSRMDGDDVNIDGFFIGDPEFRMPTNFTAFMRTQAEKELDTIRRTEPRIQRLVIPRQERQTPLVGYEGAKSMLAEVFRLSPNIEKVLGLTAAKPSSYLLKSYDVGNPTEYESDFVWHFLKKEVDFDIPYSRKLGFINPNTDISYLLGFQIIGPQSMGRFPDYDMPTTTKLHLIDSLVEEVTIHEFGDDEVEKPYESEKVGTITATVCFIPYDSSTLLTAVIFDSTASRPRDVNLYQVVAKPNVDARPFQRFGNSVITSTGKIQWGGYSNDNDVVIASFDEWAGENANQRVGQLLCAMSSSEHSTGHTFSNELMEKTTVRRESRMHPIQFITMKHRVRVPIQGGAVVLLSLGLQRYANTNIPGPRDVHLFKQLTDEEARLNITRQVLESLEADWQGLMLESAGKYTSMPEISLSQANWNPDYYACLELPRAETYSPYKKMEIPFYNFCRAHGQQPYGWWTYGEHAHESLSVFTSIITDPELAMTHLRGHLRNQSEDGGFPYGVNQNSEPEETTENATAPFIAWEAWNTYLWSGDKDFLREAYEACKQNNKWWITTRDRANKGLQHWRNFIETVRDDADLPTWTATNGAENQEALDLNCYILVQERSLAEMAKELGLAEDAECFAKSADVRAETINELLWHEEDQCYYGKDLVNDKWANIKDISTFFPLWAGLATEERAEALVKLFDDPIFKTAYPVPTLATKAPLYGSEQHWHGSNWVEMSWLPILGLKKSGHYEKAAELAYINTKMVFDELDLTSHFREYYDAETGKGALGCLYDYIWACIPAAFITQIFFGIEPKAEGLEVMPALPRDWDEISLKNLTIRGFNVSVSVSRSKRVTQTQVTVNGNAVPAVQNRGAFIPWEQLATGANIEIQQPM